eukprot:4103725-Prymnesium_polylepis.2
MARLGGAADGGERSVCRRACRAMFTYKHTRRRYGRIVSPCCRFSSLDMRPQFPHGRLRADMPAARTSDLGERQRPGGRGGWANVGRFGELLFTSHPPRRLRLLRPSLHLRPRGGGQCLRLQGQDAPLPFA